MSLLDHFHPPLAPSRHWESFHTIWSAALAEQLNSRLPGHYFAETQIHLGTRIEVDVATLELNEPATKPSGNGLGGVALESYAPPIATGVIPAVFPDDIEIQVYQESGGVTLVGAVELVSPGNKDRAEMRRAFAAKCAAYLQRGVGLAVVDIVTARKSNLHDELMELLRHGDRFPGKATLYAVAYRPVHRESAGSQIELWTMPLALGEAMPTMPLWLRGGPVMPVELEATYEEAVRRARL